MSAASGRYCDSVSEDAEETEETDSCETVNSATSVHSGRHYEQTKQGKQDELHTAGTSHAGRYGPRTNEPETDGGSCEGERYGEGSLVRRTGTQPSSKRARRTRLMTWP